MKKHILLVAFIALSNCCGCMPFWFFHYYEPGAKEGKIVKTLCHRSIGPSDAIVISYDAVDVEVSVVEISEGVEVNITYHIPEGKTVTLQERTVSISSCEDPEKIISGSMIPVFNYDNLNAPLVGSRYEISKRVTTSSAPELVQIVMPKPFWTKSKIMLPKSECVNVLVPTFGINGNSFTLPLLKFKKNTFFQFIMPINC